MTTAEFDPPFEVLEPVSANSPLLYNSPHSGNVFPARFLAQSRLSLADLRRSADLFVDGLLIGAVSRGVPLVRAHFPRCFLDVNREPYELDPGMFEGKLPDFANSRSSRVAAGYGTVARLVTDQHPVYRGRIPVAEALRRIDGYYLPYHATLRRHLSALHRRFGRAVLVDWHSMPSAAFPAHRGADIVLGDRHGASCNPELVDFVEHMMRGLGFMVQRNQPYAGGFITEHYGNPARGLHALQIEINRALYMDEARLEPNAGFAAMQDALMQFTEALVGFEQGGAQPMAAE